MGGPPLRALGCCLLPCVLACAAACAWLWFALPQPTDGSGARVLTLASLLKAYVGLFAHSAGLGLEATPRLEISEEVLASAPPRWTLHPIPELRAGVDFDSREGLLRAFAPFRNRRPVLIKGFLAGGGASRAWTGSFQRLSEPWWTVEHLGKELSGVEVRVFQNYSTDDSIVWKDFREYADALVRDPDSIMYGRAISEHWEVRPDMLELMDQDLISELAGRPWAWKRLLQRFHEWVGAAVIFVSGRVPTTRLHADLGESFVLATEGRKRWRLFGPENSLLLRPKGMVKDVGFTAGFDAWAPDFAALPQLRLCEGWEGAAEAGDLLYFPSQTWHGVENLGERNVIVDVATFDFVRSVGRNWPQSLVTMLHPGAFVDLVRYCALGAESNDGHRLPSYACGKEVYFQGYRSVPRDEV